jgi:amino acid adenylation domain-containing protein
MTTVELLSSLLKQNIQVSADNGQITVKGPEGALTAELRRQLMEQKEAILKFLNDAAGSVRHSEATLQRVSRDGRLPLSFAQQRLWFLDQYEPGSAVYNVAGALRLKGLVDVGALERSVNEIIRRHESLRTTFAMVEGEPVQVICPSLSISVVMVDLTEQPESEREDRAQRLASEEARRPFDLARGPLLRASLIRLSEAEHVLVLTMHHIVSDGWSMGVLYRELSVLYRAFSQGQPSPLTELPIQYGDFAVWQREWLKGEVLQSQLAYWKKQLEGAPGVLNLPMDRGRPAVQSFRGARQSLLLSKELTQGLKGLSRKHGVTLFMTLLAAFQTLLYRYTGQEDIVVGSPIANRNRTEIEGLIGFFVNTLVLRSNFTGNPTFKELLGRVREMALGAYGHQDLPFEKLVEELKPERSLSHSPLFQVMFVLQNAPLRDRDLSGLALTRMTLDNSTAKFDLNLSMNEQTSGLKGSLEYNTDLFDDATITRMLEHFHALLEKIVADPEQRVDALPLLGPAEKHRLLVEWNDTKREYPKDRCIHQLFEQQVEKTPAAIAVIFEEQQLTYKELNARSNQLAHYLKKQGVGPESLVGICVERSLEMIIGLLAIVKAGGGYVPLDPCFPTERLALMVKDAKIALILTQQSLLKGLAPLGANMLCLDRDWGQIAEENTDNPDSGVIAENLAYVIYTSGSTGKPKGVEVPHHTVLNVLTHVREALGLTEQDRVPLVANICFDISVMELFLPLISGARLIVASSGVVVDGAAIEHILSKCGVTIMHATPATWRLLLQAGWNGVENLTILAGGEALESELANQLAARGSSVWNLYGPTETTIYSSAAAYRSQSSNRKISIGRPVANTQIYIVDDHLQPTPVGVPGHLHIGGEGLARGYLNRSDLTAEKFIPDPFSEISGARLYRTGDLARYLSDGNIEFLGRIDHQVKLRGFRIELGEIEAVLAEHREVRQAVVLAREDVPGDKRLVAYIVLSHSEAASASELRAFLRAKLPEYMVPSAFVFLDAMPLTTNGKLDRKALAAPDQIKPELDQTFVASCTPVEQLLARIWAEVLKVEKVGSDANFFDLGGHSLKATQVISRVRQALQVDLPLRVLFEARTVAELALRIEQGAFETTELSRNLVEVESLSEEETEHQLAQEATETNGSRKIA